MRTLNLLPSLSDTVLKEHTRKDQAFTFESLIDLAICLDNLTWDMGLKQAQTVSNRKILIIRILLKPCN